MFAGAVICAFQLAGAETAPRVRAVDVGVCDVVERNGDTEHTCKRDNVCTDVTACECSVVCAPVSHYGVDVLEGVYIGASARNEPR